MISQSIGHYSILEKLGEGGMGAVYKARDLRLERFVALKLLPADKMTDADRRARFIHEAKTASALNHPNIITIHDIAEQDGQTFIVMELVEGKPLNELIPRKGMRLTEALPIAAQVADALTAAHAAGIVHRDLKPGNLMVDMQGHVKVLDFGLAKLSVRAGPAVGVDETTRTMAVDQPRTEEGVVLGSVPYMSPEQAEGKPVDARSDIFSFGAVLYEMVAGQRAFRGESRASTLAAVVEKEPPPLREIAPTTPPELERLIARCLRKDVSRRSQNMADVKLALEEFRDEPESGKLVRSDAVAPAPRGPRRWLWPAVVVASLLLAAAAIAWTYLNRRGAAFQGPDLVRLSPDDGYSYDGPSISPDGKFVTYISERGGSPQVWLQQVAGGEPIQLTHSDDPVMGALFFPDGARLLYATNSADGKRGSIAVIPTLGGQPRVLTSTHRLHGVALSTDGRQGAYFESESPSPTARVRLMVGSLDGGQPRELPNWAQMQPLQASVLSIAWTSDNRYLLCVGSKRAETLGVNEWEWFALPADGGSPRPTGAGDALRAAGLKLGLPRVVVGDRVLFEGGRSERMNVWEIRLSPDSWRVRGAPRQLTFGTENQSPFSISNTGVVALDLYKPSADLYLIPLSAANGQPTGVSRRLTHDGRYKIIRGAGGDPGSAIFFVNDIASSSGNGYALDLESGRQTLMIPGLALTTSTAVSLDGRQIAWSIPEGDSYSIRIGDAGAARAAARPLCKGCGLALRFSADGRFLMFWPEARVALDPKRRKYTLRLLEVASGKDRPWLEHPSDSIINVGTFGDDSTWITFRLQPVGSQAPSRIYIVPWREEPVPLPEWIEVNLPTEYYTFAPHGNFFQFFQGSRLMAIRFDPKTRTFSDPYEVTYVPGTAETPRPDDLWGIRGPGLVFSRREISSSAWLMKLPQ
ncbi:MAG TPA: protein kinase [Bryobacteraceae bacterium]|nr:protein kinase [Bryobacteraceae bacterium]